MSEPCLVYDHEADFACSRGTVGCDACEDCICHACWRHLDEETNPNGPCSFCGPAGPEGVGDE